MSIDDVADGTGGEPWRMAGHDLVGGGVDDEDAVRTGLDGHVLVVDHQHRDVALDVDGLDVLSREQPGERGQEEKLLHRRLQLNRVVQMQKRSQ